MQAYYEIEAEIPSDHKLQLQLPENIPIGKAKIAIIYEIAQIKNDAGAALKEFLNKYQASDIDIDTNIFEEHRKLDTDRDFSL
jgi:O-phosphoseryl-tRNA(Cys) synthetase